MSTVNHIPLAHAGPLTQVAMEAPLGQLDAAIEDVRALIGSGGSGGGGGGSSTTSPWIDIRDYGALGNFHDDTAALQAAVNYLTRPRADDWQSLSVYATGGTFTLKYGASTTGPIAYNVGAATIQSALQALPSIGAGNVTVVDAAGTGKWRATFVGALSALATGVHNLDIDIDPTNLLGPGFGTPPNDVHEVQVAYWDQGMGGDINCPGIHGISSTVLIQSSNIRIHAGRDAPGMAGTAYSRFPAYPYPINSGLVWVGADLGGPMVYFKAGQGEPLSGIGFHGSLYAGRFNMATGAFPSAANVGLRVDGATHSDFDVHTVEFKDVGFWIRACDTNPEIHHQWRGNNFLDIRRISGRQWLHNGNVFRCDARDLQQGNSYYTRVGMIDYIHRDGDAIVLGNSDTWMIGIIGGYRAKHDDGVTQGSGVGVRFKATPLTYLPSPPNPPGTMDYDHSSGMHRITIIEHADPGIGSFVFEGTDVNSVTPCFIEIRNWRTPNVGTPANPTIGPGVDGIYWRILRSPALPMSGTAFPAQP